MKTEKKFGFFSVLVSIIFIAGILGISKGEAIGGSDVIKWRCQAFFPAGGSQFRKVENFCKEVKERSNGRLLITPYGGRSLMPNSEILKGTKRGMVEMGVTSSAYVQEEIPLARVAYGMPFNFDRVEDALYFWMNLGFEETYRKEFAKHGLYYGAGEVQPLMFVLKKPIRSIGEFKGKKLRTVGLVQDLIRLLGGAATYIPGSDIYSALATGVVDGASWGGPTGINDIHLYDVCKYHLDVPFSYGSWAYIFNRKDVDKLPKDIQIIIHDLLRKHIWKSSLDYAITDKQTALKVQKEKGVEFIKLPPEDVKKIRMQGIRLWDEKIASRSPENAKAVEMLKEYMRSIGGL